MRDLVLHPRGATSLQGRLTITQTIVINGDGQGPRELGTPAACSRDTHSISGWEYHVRVPGRSDFPFEASKRAQYTRRGGVEKEGVGGIGRPWGTGRGQMWGAGWR